VLLRFEVRGFRNRFLLSMIFNCFLGTVGFLRVSGNLWGTVNMGLNLNAWNYMFGVRVFVNSL
jgi:hypothetical protein